MRILSWNVLKEAGARAEDVAALIERHRPDLLLLQEATPAMDGLPGLVGGHYLRREMAKRGHGPAAWSPLPFEAETVGLARATSFDLPVPVFRTIAPRLALVVRLGGLVVANVHLDHGQRANRRQLRHLLRDLPADVVMGDFNALGPLNLPGFADVGPRRRTHWAYRVVPLRLDRCLVRGLPASGAVALGFGRSDHRAILVDLGLSAPVGAGMVRPAAEG